MGMDSAALFKIGEQNAQCYGGYVYHCPTRLRGPSHRFVVNYIEDAPHGLIAIVLLSITLSALAFFIFRKIKWF